MRTLLPLLRYVLIVAAALYLMNQVRKPTKWGGRPFLWMMNSSHSTVTDWGLLHVRVEKDFTILDVGCGGGRTIQKLAALAANGKIYGLDYANGSVAASRATNAQLIQTGKVEIEQASVSQLPFSDDKFDLVTAIETQYYWPDLLKDMQEILRVLKPGGTLLVIAESYKKGPADILDRSVMKFLRAAYMSVEEYRELFSSAGYTEVRISEQRTKGWVCAIGKKSASALN